MQTKRNFRSWKVTLVHQATEVKLFYPFIHQQKLLSRTPNKAFQFYLCRFKHLNALVIQTYLLNSFVFPSLSDERHERRPRICISRTVCFKSIITAYKQLQVILHLPKPLSMFCKDRSPIGKSQTNDSWNRKDRMKEGGRKTYFPVHCRATNDELALFRQHEFCLHSFQTKTPFSSMRSLRGRKQNVGQERGNPAAMQAWKPTCTLSCHQMKTISSM